MSLSRRRVPADGVAGTAAEPEPSDLIANGYRRRADRLGSSRPWLERRVALGAVAGDVIATTINCERCLATWFPMS